MKNLKKLVAVSAVAATLATVSTPAAHAYVDLAGNDWGSLVNVVDQDDVFTLSQEISNRISAHYNSERDVTGPAYDAAKVEWEKAAKAEKDAQADYDKKLAEHTAAVAELEAAEKAAAEATRYQQQVEADYVALVRVLREAAVTKEYDARLVRDNALAEAYKIDEEAKTNYNLATEALNIANALPETTDEEKALKKAEVDKAIVGQAAALIAYNDKAAEEAAAVNAANGAYEAAVADAHRAVTEGERQFAAKYLDTGIYGIDGVLVDAQNRLDAANGRVLRATSDEATKAANLRAAETALSTASRIENEKLTAMRQAEVALTKDQQAQDSLRRELQVLLNDKARRALEGNNNLTEEQKEIVKEALGIDSATLQKRIESNANKISELEKTLPGNVNEPKKEVDVADADKPAVDPNKPAVDPNKPAVDPNKPGATDANKPGATDSNKPAAKPAAPKSNSAQLPATGESTNFAVLSAAVLSILAGLGLVAPKFKKED